MPMALYCVFFFQQFTLPQLRSNDFSNRYQTEHWAFGVPWQQHTLSLKATKTQQDKKINYKYPIRVRDESVKLS